ncbi:hypothetical protein AVEN_43670-1 [Araneus ventricosus]|uniref:DUF7041 domain-containing protein n=1 Tax=Araneus ventricosus TaxID=182803 RepID=A0A4Y2IZ47_ARAVE|nr:hypothetical protein AVEN_43670-1 [Araneus ventricosus]
MNESSDSSDNKSVSHFVVSHIAVKVPPFWRDNPTIWFSQLESQFITSGIVQYSTKYHTVVASVETEIHLQVRDIITSRPNNDMYKTLKEHLVNVFSDSEECRLKKLLQDVELGEKRPSMLLLQMQDLAGNRVGDELLRSLWLQRLPTQMQAILTTNSDDLNKLSIMADKIADVTSGSEMCSNHVKTKTSIPNDCISNLQAQISERSLKIDRMSQFRIYRSMSRRNNSRSRSASRKGQNQPRWEHVIPAALKLVSRNIVSRKNAHCITYSLNKVCAEGATNGRLRSQNSKFLNQLAFPGVTPLSAHTLFSSAYPLAYEDISRSQQDDEELDLLLKEPTSLILQKIASSRHGCDAIL